MVSSKKFQVYDWFRTLDGAKRIDFLNGMLHLCFPLELRFLGSCIEELARKEYSYLRDAELKANAAYEIQLMSEISDKVTRSKMIVTLALLGSSNVECARLLYDLLDVDIASLLEKMEVAHLDQKIADEFLLMLTMAANHPAFDFQMKTRMSQLYLCAEQKLRLKKVLPGESDADLCLLCSNGAGCARRAVKDTKVEKTENKKFYLGNGKYKYIYLYISESLRRFFLAQALRKPKKLILLNDKIFIWNFRGKTSFIYHKFNKIILFNSLKYHNHNNSFD